MVAGINFLTSTTFTTLAQRERFQGAEVPRIRLYYLYRLRLRRLVLI